MNLPSSEIFITQNFNLADEKYHLPASHGFKIFLWVDVLILSDKIKVVHNKKPDSDISKFCFTCQTI